MACSSCGSKTPQAKSYDVKKINVVKALPTASSVKVVKKT